MPAVAGYDEVVRATPGVTAYWKLDEPAGAGALADVVGGNTATSAATVANAYAAELGRPGLVPNSPGTALRPGFFTVPFTAALNPQQFSIEMWVRDDGNGGYVDLVSSFSGNTGFRVRVVPVSNGIAAVRMYTGDGASTPMTIARVATVLGQTVHVVVTVGAGGVVHAYSNGQLFNVGTRPYVPVTAASPGAFRFGAATGVNAVVDNVSYYDRALSAEAVKEHFDAGTAPVLVTAPGVSGSARKGETLVSTPGDWSGTAPVGFSREWQRCSTGRDGCSVIAGATGTSYALTSGDVGSTIRVKVAASNAAGSATAVSSVTDRVSGGLPELAALSHTTAPPAGPVQSFTDDVTATATSDGAGVASLVLRGLTKGDVTYQVDCPAAPAACPQSVTHTFRVDTTDLRPGAVNELSVTAVDRDGRSSNREAFTVELKPSCAQTDSCTNAAKICTDPAASTSAAGGAATPTLRDSGDTLTADGAVADTTISKNADNGILVQTDDTAVCLTPVQTAPQAASAKIVDDGSSAKIDTTAKATDTLVVPKADGVETFEKIKSSAATEEFSWKVSLEENQQLLPGADGSVAIVDTSVPDTAPEPGPVTPADPSQLPALKQAGTVPEDVQAPDPAAVARANAAVSESGLATLPPPAADGSTSAAQAAVPESARNDVVLPTETPQGAQPLPADAPPAGLAEPGDGDPLPRALTDQLTAGQPAAEQLAKEIAQQDLDAAKAGVQGANAAQDVERQAAAVQAGDMRAVAVIKPPISKDAAGETVPTSLTVEGDTVTMHVEHKDDSYAYPVMADPWVKVNDYQWRSHCCRPVYEWQPRSHQETRFAYVGSYYGNKLIHQKPHYLWGNGRDGRKLYAVWITWGGKQGWHLVHNEYWSGIFTPYQITVQDPLVRVLVGWQSWWSYDKVGSHLEFHFDPAIDCNPGERGAVLSRCAATGPDDTSEEEPEDVSFEPVAQPRGATVVSPKRLQIHVKTDAAVPAASRWATIRNRPQAYVVGNARNGWTIDARAISNDIGTNQGQSPAKWYLGLVQGTAGATLASPGASVEVFSMCGWVMARAAVGPPDYSVASPCRGLETNSPDIEEFSWVYNCVYPLRPGRECNKGTPAELTRATHKCANVGMTRNGITAGCKNLIPASERGYLGKGQCVLWRYITSDGKWAMVSDRPTPSAQGRWAFIPRNALEPDHKLKNVNSPGKTEC